MGKKSSNKGKKPTSAPATRSRSKSKSKSPESSPSATNDVNFGGEGWGENPPLLKTPKEVLAELTTSDNENSGGSPPPPCPSPTAVREGQSSGGGGGGGASMIAIASAVAMANAVAIAAGSGGPVIVGASVGPAVAGAVRKKRRSSAVKNPPSGIPTCPICFKTFASWKGAFGHMRKHPERDYRGFFKPPTFSSSFSSTTAGGEDISAVLGSGEGGSGSSPVGGLVFDLNIPLDDASDEENDGNEGNRVGFDLNEFPATDDEEEEDEAA